MPRKLRVGANVARALHALHAPTFQGPEARATGPRFSLPRVYLRYVKQVRAILIDKYFSREVLRRFGGPLGPAPSGPKGCVQTKRCTSPALPRIVLGGDHSRPP